MKTKTLIHMIGGTIFHVEETLDEIWELLDVMQEGDHGCVFLTGNRPQSAMGSQRKSLRISSTQIQAMEER